MPKTNTSQKKDAHRTLVVFRCPTTLADALAGKAARCETSVSAIIRQMLKAGLLKSV
jgi:hypothetical protein